MPNFPSFQAAGLSVKSFGWYQTRGPVCRGRVHVKDRVEMGKHYPGNRCYEVHRVKNLLVWIARICQEWFCWEKMAKEKKRN